MPDRGLPSALGRFDDVVDRLRTPFAVFLDFDGTLAPIVEHPAEARLPEATREALAELVDERPVAIVSGRQAQDVRDRVGLDGLVYVGDHGFEVIGGPEEAQPPRPEGLEAQLAAAREALEDALAGIEGVWVQAKAFSLAVHHRQADPEAAEPVQAAVDQVLAEHPLLAGRRGKEVVELVPAVDRDKGHAVAQLREAWAGERGLGAVYVGDDTTDETAFAMLGEGDVGVLVAEEPRATAAGYRLADPGEVRAFVSELARRCRGSGGEP